MLDCSFGDTTLKSHLLLTGSLLASLTLIPSAASAYDHPGEHNSAQHIRRVRESEHERHLREDRERHERLERKARLQRERDEHRRRDRHGFRDQDRDHDRRGWEKGQKRGWKGGSLPPGQEKKAERGR
jgi:hypothetical protein